jgi:hypothetical protein
MRRPDPRLFRNNPFLPPLSEAEKGYIAGIIDGEGSILKPNKTKGWVIQIRTTDKELCDWLKQKIPQSFIQNCKDTGFSKKPVYQWRLVRQLTIYQLLEQIYPFLMLKHPKAEEALICMGNIFTK